MQRRRTKHGNRIKIAESVRKTLRSGRKRKKQRWRKRRKNRRRRKQVW